jgi:hypothetical protein
VRVPPGIGQLLDQEQAASTAVPRAGLPGLWWSVIVDRYLEVGAGLQGDGDLPAAGVLDRVGDHLADQQLYALDHRRDHAGAQ